VDPEGVTNQPNSLALPQLISQSNCVVPKSHIESGQSATYLLAAAFTDARVRARLHLLPVVAYVRIADRPHSFSQRAQATGWRKHRAALDKMSGHGNTVFDMPASVGRALIRGVWSGNGTSNFIVRLAGRGLVNEMLRDMP
jgi:hypothetical protein